MFNTNFGGFTFKDIDQHKADALEMRLEKLTGKADSERSADEKAIYNYFFKDGDFKDKTFDEVKIDFKKVTGLELTDILFPTLDAQVISAFMDRMNLLDTKRNNNLGEIKLSSGKMEVLTKIQAMISAEIKGIKDKDETRNVPEEVSFTAEDIAASPSLKTFLETIPNAGLPGPVTLKTSDLIGTLVAGLDSSSYSAYTGLDLKDFRSVSESISNQIKVFNDQTNRLTTEYQDFSNKYDATVDAIGRFLDRYFQALARIQNNTA